MTEKEEFEKWLEKHGSEYPRALAEKNGTTDEWYGQFVSSLIATRYSQNAENALNRQRDRKAEEFAEYDRFCESVKDFLYPWFFGKNRGE